MLDTVLKRDGKLHCEKAFYVEGWIYMERANRAEDVLPLSCAAPDLVIYLFVYLFYASVHFMDFLLYRNM